MSETSDEPNEPSAPGTPSEPNSPADPDEPRAKDVVDAATRADLERWFGLPSFTELADRGITLRPEGQGQAGQAGHSVPGGQDDPPEVIDARKRREAAIAAVDPAMLEAHRRRVDVESLRFVPIIVPVIDVELGRVDLAMLGNRSASYDLREVE